MPKKGVCSICESSTSNIYATYCRSCYRESLRLEEPARQPTEGEIKEQNRHRYEIRRKYVYKKRYGITEERYQEMLVEQGNCCAICGVNQETLTKRMSVDHDHNCCPGLYSCGNCLRGLLCSHCNLALGGFKDSEGVLRSALRYLSIYRNEEPLD